ncbi:MAG: hypothetical protein ABR609_09245 [Acidimicrobiia bacterium]
MKGYPPSVVAALGGLDVEEVAQRCGVADLDAVPIRRAPRWMVRAWRGDVAAMTLPFGIFVRADCLTGDRTRLANTVQHELVHVRQWKELGVLRFLWRYLADYLQGRQRGLGHTEAYRQISFEQEARRIAGH